VPVRSNSCKPLRSAFEGCLKILWGLYERIPRERIQTKGCNKQENFNTFHAGNHWPSRRTHHGEPSDIEVGQDEIRLLPHRHRRKPYRGRDEHRREHLQRLQRFSVMAAVVSNRDDSANKFGWHKHIVKTYRGCPNISCPAPLQLGLSGLMMPCTRLSPD
jgi:hypothetical protein